MEKRFDVVEKDGRFHLYEGGQEYLTPCFFPISSYDKGLVEAIARKLGEGKPNLVMLYLRKYDNAELVDIIKDLTSVDTYFGWYKITNNSKLCAEVFKNIQLRRLIDAYSACGSMGLVINIAARDVEEDYDDFFPGMAVTSGIYASPYDDEADFLYDMLCEHIEDLRGMDVSETLSTDYLADFVIKYNAILVPKGERARRKFSDLLAQLQVESDPGDAADDDEADAEELQRIADRMAQLDAETLRKFNIVREFVSKYDDFWADFEDCDAVYRPFFHCTNIMRFWFNPPYDEKGVSYPCESDKLILTKKGEIYVEDHGDGEFYNILDCVGSTLDNAVYAIETHVEDSPE